MSASGDIVMSANDEIPGQHLLTLSRKDIQKGDSLVLANCGTLLPDILNQNRTAKRLTAAVRNHSKRNQFCVSALVGGSGWVSQSFCASLNGFVKRVN